MSLLAALVEAHDQLLCLSGSSNLLLSFEEYDETWYFFFWIPINLSPQSSRVPVHSLDKGGTSWSVCEIAPDSNLARICSNSSLWWLNTDLSVWSSGSMEFSDVSFNNSLTLNFLILKSLTTSSRTFWIKSFMKSLSDINDSTLPHEFDIQRADFKCICRFLATGTDLGIGDFLFLETWVSSRSGEKSPDMINT